MAVVEVAVVVEVAEVEEEVVLESLRWLWCPPSPLLLLLWNRGIGYSHPSRHMVCRWCWRYLTVPETKDAFPLVRRHLHAHLSSTGLGL